MNFITAGESHGPCLTGIIDHFPAGLTVDIEKINQALAQRQKGYGRGGRMKIEQDKVQILSGIRHQKTMGSPITFQIENRDFKNWQKEMSALEPYETKRGVYTPRPGHADLVGGIKYGQEDMRNVLERSSARETAMRVAIGALCAQLLEVLGITLQGRVFQIGPVKDLVVEDEFTTHNDLRVVHEEVAEEMRAWIQKAKEEGTTLGGGIEVIVKGMPAGVGDYTQWNRKLDARLSYAVMSINAMKGITFGDGISLIQSFGKDVMDEIAWKEEEGYYRLSNHLGGIEGGMSTGMPIRLQAYMKPIPTQYHPLQTVDVRTKEIYQASVERSDHCAVPSASYVVEAVVATTLVEILCEQFTSDTVEQLKEAVEKQRKRGKDL